MVTQPGSSKRVLICGYGVYRRIGYKHGAWHDVAWLQLPLAAALDAPPEPC